MLGNCKYSYASSFSRFGLLADLSLAEQSSNDM